MQVDLEILVYAVIAAILLGRLWTLLGTRNDHEQQRPNPLSPQQPNPQNNNTANAKAQSADKPAAATRLQALAPPPRSLAGGLAQVMEADPTFEEKSFLQEVRDIFTSVVGAYAAGRLSMVSEYLSPALMEQFQKGIDQRKAEGDATQTKIAKINEAEVTAARTEKNQAIITVRFVSQQEDAAPKRDANLENNKSSKGLKHEEITDLWTFARDTQTPASRWMVVETRG